VTPSPSTHPGAIFVLSPTTAFSPTLTWAPSDTLLPIVAEGGTTAVAWIPFQNGSGMGVMRFRTCRNATYGSWTLMKVTLSRDRLRVVSKEVDTRIADALVARTGFLDFGDPENFYSLIPVEFTTYKNCDFSGCHVRTLSYLPPPGKIVSFASTFCVRSYLTLANIRRISPLLSKT
jgi:hypothetical protein